MKWKLRKGTKICCPLSFVGNYVISHRPGLYTISYRPPGHHIHVGTRNNLKAAKQLAELHSLT